MNMRNRLLESEGFEQEYHSAEGYDCDYEKVIPHDGMYVLYVDVSFKDRKVYFYDEYDCGGVISNHATIIPDAIDLESLSFIEWLKSEIEDYI